MHRILIVEDDPVIGEQIQKQLSAWGSDVRRVTDFNAVMADFAAFQPELVLLDISLPFYNGYYWCTEIRSVSKVPIIFLSSSSDNMNIVMAMNLGADDFIAKPFDMSVLIAKIQALLRRTYDFGGQTELGVLEHQGALLNRSDASLMVGGQKVDLTRNEYRILEILMSHPGRIVSRDDLMIRLWETESFVDENTLTVNVARLRRKLESVGLTDFIKTKKGMGYVVE